MSLAITLKVLQKQKEELQDELASLDQAIVALTRVARGEGKGAPVAKKKKKGMSAAGRARIRQAQLKRWKEFKQAKKAKTAKKGAAKKNKKADPAAGSETPA
jgi:hypothetical protein